MARLEQLTMCITSKLTPVNRETNSICEAEETAMAASAAAPSLVPSSTEAKSQSSCLHCGEPCLDAAILEEGRRFCCLGCRTVFALLTEAGLGRFYELAPSPGSQIRGTGGHEPWAFLNAPGLQTQLLDYVDEVQARVTLHIPAIHCVACVWLLENLYRLNPGIGESRVNFTRREISIHFNRSSVSLSEIASLLASLGYEPALTLDELNKKERSQAPTWHKKQWLQVGIAGFGFGNVMLLALPGYLGLDSVSGPWFSQLAGWLGLVLALPVLIYSASDFWRAAWLSWRQRVLTLDVPIAIGLAAIYGQSLFNVATGSGDSYCDSLTGLIFFLLCGRVFQRQTFDRMFFDRDYKGFFPLAVLRKTPQGEETVAISELTTGDRLIIRHGELIPADARLRSNQALVDYSFVTGESEPVVRHETELLYAGGRQQGGSIEIETVKAVSESYLTSLWGNKAFSKDRDCTLDSQTNLYTRRFTLTIVAVSVGAAIAWMPFDSGTALRAFTSVLIVACPCALALAAPLTLGSAQRWLAGRRVFLRNAQLIERMAGIDTVVFDKTGTLTTVGSSGVLWHGAALTAVERSWLSALTSQSAHPLAIRITHALGSRRASLPEQAFAENSGQGIEGTVEGREIWIGSAAWLASRGTILDREAVPAASGVQVAVNGRHRGGFSINCTLRPEVETLVRQLRDRHALVLLSGDNDHETERFAALFGPTSRIAFNQTPFDKLKVVQELQEAGHKVMMVGDGLNDAGALRQADVGVAVVERVGTFSPASDVILDAPQLRSLSRVLEFSRHASRIVRIGFVVSGLYNVVGISIAAAGLLSPLVCAVLMPLSSVTMVVFSIGATRGMARYCFRAQHSPRKGFTP